MGSLGKMFNSKPEWGINKSINKFFISIKKTVWSHSIQYHLIRQQNI